MSQRIVTGVDRDEKGRIQALFGDADQGWSPVTRREAAAGITSSVHTYVAVAASGASSDIHTYNGTWLRTAPDKTSSDNLDVLGGPDYGHFGAGAFGIVVGVSAEGVDKLARELHASNSIVSRVVLLHADKLVTVVLGVPRFEPTSEPHRFEIVRDAICHVRDVANATDPGTSAAVTVTAECEVSVKTKAQLNVVTFTLAYSVPARGAVTLQAPIAEPARSAIVTTLTEWVAGSRSDQWDLEANGMLAGVTRVDPNFDASGQVQVGFRFDGKRAGEFPAVPNPITAHDWTVALSRPYVVERIGQALRSYFSDLPAPMGEAWRVTVPGVADVALSYLEVNLVPGAVVVSGVAIKGIDATISAKFSGYFSLDLDVDGQVSATLVDTEVEVVEWYAKVADFLTGGLLVDSIAEGLRSALGTLGSNAAGGLMSAELLTRVVAGGTSGTANVTAMPRRVWIEPGAVNLGGDLERAPAPVEVVAANLGTRVDATLTAAPGTTIREVRWDSGGTVVTQTYERRALSFAPPAGATSVTVTVTTDEGQTASSTIAL